MKKISTFVLGVVVGGTLFSGVTVGATSIVKNISATINDSVSISVNGETVKLENQPINYDNLNYIPVGEISRVLGSSVQYDKNSNTIEIEKKESGEEMTNSSSTVLTTNEEAGVVLPPATPTTPVISEMPVEVPIAPVKMGTSITKDGITVKIDKVEFITEEEEINGIFIDKGFKVFTTITNNSDINISRLGSLYRFKTNSTITDKPINNLGNISFLKIDGVDYQGGSLAKGKTATGFIYYQFNQDTTINNVEYYLHIDNTQQKTPIGIWEQ